MQELSRRFVAVVLADAFCFVSELLQVYSFDMLVY